MIEKTDFSYLGKIDYDNENVKKEILKAEEKTNVKVEEKIKLEDILLPTITKALDEKNEKIQMKYFKKVLKGKTPFL